MHKEPIYFQKLALELFQLRILSFHFQRPGLHTRKEPRKKERERESERARRIEKERERGSSERSAIIPQRFPRVEDTESTTCLTANRVSRVLPNGGRKRYPEAGNGRALLYGVPW